MFTVQNDTILVDNNRDKNVKKDNIDIDNNVDEEEEETTIEEVMEELQNIINDAETDYNAERNKNDKKDKKLLQTIEKEENALARHYRRINNISSDDLTSEALILEDETDIVPVRLLPQPPRRSRSLFLPEHNNYDDRSPFFEDDDESLESSDSLLSMSRDHMTFDSEQTFNRRHNSHYRKQKNNCLKRRETILIDRRLQPQRDAHIKRSETFHNVMNQCYNNRNEHHSYSNLYQPQQRQNEINSEIKSRRGSFDGLFYVAELPSTPVVSSEPVRKSRGTTVFINKSPESSRKLKSKSLDRIVGDGLDSLVDIVVTSETKKNDFKNKKQNDERYSSHVINNKGSSVIIVSRSPPVQNHFSSSQLHQNIYENNFNNINNNNNCCNKPYFNKLTDDTLSKYPSDRKVFLPLHRNPSPTDAQKFVVKRGYTNAGLYSGQHNIRDGSMPNLIQNNNSNNKNLSPVLSPNDYYNRGLNTLKHANISASSGKLSDLPSGLY